MHFDATEIGFDGSLGGASNSNSEAEYHYVLFGIDPETGDAYFEYDDQINGGLGVVERVAVRGPCVEFSLSSGKAITVGLEQCRSGWPEFRSGLSAVFQGRLVVEGEEVKDA